MDGLQPTVQALAIVSSAGLLLFVLELVRRRRLSEAYAILWLLASSVLLVLSIFDGLLDEIANLFGVEVPVNALFAVGFGFLLALTLSVSSVISRLTRDNKLLAQEVARLDHELREVAEIARPSPRDPPPG